MSLPLAGRRIVVTRARHQAGRLSEALRALGAEVIELPVIEIVPPASYAALDEALRNIHLYQWLIFTSANAVRVMAERLHVLKLEARSFAHCKVVAVGPSTAEALSLIGVQVNVIPATYVAEGVVEALRDQVRGARVLLIRAKVARDVIPDTLRGQGAVVDVVEAYETVLPTASIGSLPAVLASVPDAVTFTSSSTVKNFVALLRACHIAVPPPGLQAISIGPVTSESLRDCGWGHFTEAMRFDLTGLVEATVRALAA